MATDYDTPRKTDDDVDSDSLEELKARRNDKSTSAVDVDEFEAAEGLELPGADLSNEELAPISPGVPPEHKRVEVRLDEHAPTTSI